MDKSIIKEICSENGLIDNTFFIEWFSQAFPNENNRIRSYCAEWVSRFKSGSPEAFMDNIRLAVYNKMREK